MDRKPELRLPTTAVPVTLGLVAGTKVEAEIFIGEAARSGHGQLLDDVAAMFDEATSFVPVRVDTKVVLYAKSAIAFVAIAREPSEVITLYDRQHHVNVELSGALVLSGTLFDSSPADRPRAIDHLNRAGRFLRLWTEGTHYLINKDQIVRVSEQEL
jgi:hypothetical protein